MTLGHKFNACGDILTRISQYLFTHLGFLSPASNSHTLRSAFSDELSESRFGFTVFHSTAFAPHICVTVEARLHLPASVFLYRR